LNLYTPENFEAIRALTHEELYEFRAALYYHDFGQYIRFCDAYNGYINRTYRDPYWNELRKKPRSVLSNAPNPPNDKNGGNFLDRMRELAKQDEMA
jgi:hypothetical protein